ncbi:hypothetical protein U1Q18_027073 [Sarracenia purpurea var. burkii]
MSVQLTYQASQLLFTSLSYARGLKGFLDAWSPSSPLPHVNELLRATAEFERNFEVWNISPVQGVVDSIKCITTTLWFGYRNCNSTYLIFARQKRCCGLEY